MICNYQQTGEVGRNGRPLWRCVNVGCKHKISTAEPPQNQLCDAPESTPTCFLQLPCIHRGPTESIEVEACCGGTAEVEAAACSHESNSGKRCTMAGIQATISCRSCKIEPKEI